MLTLPRDLDTTEQQPSAAAPTKKNHETWNQWVPMDEELFQALQLVHLCMLQAVHEIFTAHEIPYWICGGTLLGAIRHEGFIPHDDDADIECFERDIPLISAIPSNPPLYMGFVPDAGTWNSHSVGKLVFFRGEFHVDVFFRSNGLPQHEQFPSHDEVFPLKLYKFHNIELWGPGGNPATYLDRCYGKDWRDEVCVWNHDFNWFHGPSHIPRKVVLCLTEYNRLVSEAGIVSPTAQETATATFHAFCKQHGDEFYQEYQQYRFQRVCRRNRAAAEWRESLQS